MPPNDIVQKMRCNRSTFYFEYPDVVVLLPIYVPWDWNSYTIYILQTLMLNDLLKHGSLPTASQVHSFALHLF